MYDLQKYVICSAAQTITYECLQLFWPQAFHVIMDLPRRWRLLHLLYCIRNAENSTHDQYPSCKVQK